MTASNNPTRRRLFSFRKQGQVITGHQTGDVQSDEPVTIQEGAALVGNVTAPQIRVAGLLHGTAVTPDLIITASGQLWGDAIATKLQIEPGGVIQGWVGSSQDGRSAETVPDLPDDLQQNLTPPHDNAQLESWRVLQTETGQALAAYAQLKQQFETRLAEEAGAAFEEAQTRQQQLTDAKAKLADLQRQLEKAQANIETRDATIETQETALAEADEQASQQQEQLDALQETHETFLAAYEHLQGTKDEVDLALAQTRQRVDALEKRNHTLETTLQTSIQRTAEQEDALLHWQELAETTQSQLDALGKENERWERQMEESATTTGKLREKIGRLEFEWQQTQLELQELQNHKPSATEEEMKLALADKQQQIVTLKDLLDEAKQNAAETDEQILWYKASLRTTQQTLDQSRRIAHQQEALLAELQSNLADKETAVDKWKTAVEQMASRLQEQEQQITTLKVESEQSETQFKAQIAKLKETIRYKSVQIDAHEDEIKYHLKQMDEQGQRLANIQASLVERELQLEQANAKIAKQAAFVTRMKSVTSSHIAQLEAQLAQAKRLLAKSVTR